MTMPLKPGFRQRLHSSRTQTNDGARQATVEIHDPQPQPALHRHPHCGPFPIVRRIVAWLARPTWLVSGLTVSPALGVTTMTVLYDRRMDLAPELVMTPLFGLAQWFCARAAGLGTTTSLVASPPMSMTCSGLCRALCSSWSRRCST
jgi:hypothetical protein